MNWNEDKLSVVRLIVWNVITEKKFTVKYGCFEHFSAQNKTPAPTHFYWKIQIKRWMSPCNPMVFSRRCLWKKPADWCSNKHPRVPIIDCEHGFHHIAKLQVSRAQRAVSVRARTCMRVCLWASVAKPTGDTLSVNMRIHSPMWRPKKNKKKPSLKLFRRWPLGGP